jgi:CheY-like chemotaxis protein
MNRKSEIRPDTNDSYGERALRILVIEDDALIQMLMCETLISMGHRICATAATEAQAVEAAARSQPDLMIVDAHLAQGNGVTAVNRILTERWTPHVFVSGDSLLAGTLHPRAVTLQKPFQEHDLARAMALALAE